jgi:hypothetical protein
MSGIIPLSPINVVEGTGASPRLRLVRRPDGAASVAIGGSLPRRWTREDRTATIGDSLWQLRLPDEGVPYGEGAISGFSELVRVPFGREDDDNAAGGVQRLADRTAGQRSLSADMTRAVS